jgi:hypothetical protein
MVSGTPLCHNEHSLGLPNAKVSQSIDECVSHSAAQTAVRQRTRWSSNTMVTPHHPAERYLEVSNRSPCNSHRKDLEVRRQEVSFFGERNAIMQSGRECSSELQIKGHERSTISEKAHRRVACLGSNAPCSLTMFRGSNDPKSRNLLCIATYVALHCLASLKGSCFAFHSQP